MAENNRETHRRRIILEQGSDRLAFISGRIPSLPPKPPSPSPPPSLPDSDAVSNDPNTTLVTILPHGEAVEEESDFALLNHDLVVSNPYPSDASRSIAQTQRHHQAHHPEPSGEGLRRPLRRDACHQGTEGAGA